MVTYARNVKLIGYLRPSSFRKPTIRGNTGHDSPCILTIYETSPSPTLLCLCLDIETMRQRSYNRFRGNSACFGVRVQRNKMESRSLLLGTKTTGTTRLTSLFHWVGREGRRSIGLDWIGRLWIILSRECSVVLFNPLSTCKCRKTALESNRFLLCSEHSETQLKTTIHCHLS